MSAHTPGPWVAEDRCERFVVHGTGPNGESFEVASLQDGDETECDDAAREANADLIAAAPDLLAACEEALAILVYAEPANAKTEAMLRVALAKARGGK